MSWLRDHFHHFVYPAFMAAEKKSTEIGPPFHIKVSPHAPARLPTELKKLWTLVQEHGDSPWSYDVRIISAHGGNSKFRETARLHHGILRSSLDSAVAAMKREGCTRILLPGRDIYMLVPMCARRGIPFLFVPELSRPNSSQPAMRAFLEELGYDGRELLVDTGYEGSIPANLKELFPELEPIKYRFLSERPRGSKELVPRGRSDRRFELAPHQLFPNRQTARTEALETEYLAKYWKSGTVDADGRIVQYLADRRSIQRAALLTSMLFRGIPFWRVSQPSKRGVGQHYNMWQQQSVGGIINFSTAGTTSSVTTYNITSSNVNTVGGPIITQTIYAPTGTVFTSPPSPNQTPPPLPPTPTPPALPPAASAV